MYNQLLRAAFPAIAGIAAIFFTACNRKELQLEQTNANGEVPQLGNLTFRFSRALHPDSLLDQWDSTEYIRFQPAIPGKFRWEGPEELVFSPEKPLRPATNYTASFRRELFEGSHYDGIKEEEIHFHTPPLNISSLQLSWSHEKDREAEVIANFEFNYKVEPSAIADHLETSAEGEKTPFELLTSRPSDKIRVRFPALKPSDDARTVRLTLKKGLRPFEGEAGTAEDMSSSLLLEAPEHLTINNVVPEYDGLSGNVHLHMSQVPTRENIASLVRFQPAVPFTIRFDDDGMTLISESFDPDQSYTLFIDKGLRGEAGGTLADPFQTAIAFGQMESEIRFTNSKAVYLSRRGSGNLEVKITDAKKVKLVISRIYENNLLMAEKNGYYPKEERSSESEDDYQYNENYSDYDESLTATAGEIIFSKEIDTRSLPKSAGGRLLNLKQYEDILPEVKGIYHVLVRSTDEYWVRDSRFISFSDIGMIARQGNNGLSLFVNSIKTAEALSGVQLRVYGVNNQLIGKGATDGNGYAEIALGASAIPGNRAAMIIASNSNDFSYLPLRTTAVNTSRFEVGGKKLNPSGFDAFIYGERELYRPGEEIHFSVILRDAQWKSPADLPVRLRFLYPNGKEFKVFRKALNEQGAVEGAIPIPVSAITGSYNLEVYTSNGVLLGTKNFMVEEFIPDRIKLTTQLAAETLQPGTDTRLELTAVNFFGPPAANRQFENEMQVHQKQFSAPRFPDYDFSLANQRSFYDNVVKQGTTAADGKASVEVSIPELYSNSGLLEASFFTTVFDETGRPVSKNLKADIYTQDIFHGIKEDHNSYYPLNQPIPFQLLSVNRKGDPVRAQARVQIIKHEYRTVLARSGRYYRYESQTEDRMLSDQEITIGEGSIIRYVPTTPGDYELRILRPDASAYVSKSFYSYGGWAENTSFEVNADGNIEITLDKSGYRTGETAKVLFKAPFSGRMLVTMERDHVISHQYLTVQKRTASMDIQLNADHLPNVYLTATLIKPHEGSDLPLTVAHGFKSISVEAVDRKIAVAIKAAVSSRSHSTQKVTVKATPGSYVTLAAVDNGVLQVTNAARPDPYKFFYQKQALSVKAFDMYPLLFPELRGRLSSTGGDGYDEQNQRTNPMPANRVKILSYWSGLKKAGANGEASFEYKIDQFSGQVKLIAVAFKDQNFGSADFTTIVADPVVLSAGLPRFISPGDTVLVPLTITNTRKTETSASVTAAATGGVRILESAPGPLKLAGNAEGQKTYRMIAGPVPGIARISFSVTSNGEKFVDETEISIRPPSTLQKRSGSGSLTGGQTQRISIPSTDFLPAGAKYELIVGTSPAVEFSDRLRYLVAYPYGCTEQIVSSVFPQLYLADLSKNLGSSQQANVSANVAEAIRKIKMRQLYNGALTLWDGEQQEQWWVSAYAAHFLIEARKAGYDVDDALLNPILSFLTSRLRSKETIPYYYNRDQNRRIAPKEVPYSLYVLALAGRAQSSSMNYYKSNPQLLALDGKYLLSAAYALAGDRRSFASLLPTSFSGEESVQQTGGSFYSALRDEALSLNALLESDPAHAQIPVLARQLADRLKRETYPNTQECSFTFLALGKMARAAAASDVTAEISSAGKTLSKGKGPLVVKNSLPGNTEITIAAKGQGRLYYSWVAQGISRTGTFVQEDQFIKARRRYFDRNGQPVTGNSFRQNDLVIVELTVEKAYNGSIENIVLTDLLPAGFEIENPRTKEIPGMDWIKRASEPTSLDVRDDRINLFIDSYSPVQRYYYAVRAVSPGIYRQGPVSADAMYDGAIHSYHGAGWIRIETR